MAKVGLISLLLVVALASKVKAFPPGFPPDKLQTLDKGELSDEVAIGTKENVALDEMVRADGEEGIGGRVEENQHVDEAVREFPLDDDDADDTERRETGRCTDEQLCDKRELAIETEPAPENLGAEVNQQVEREFAVEYEGGERVDEAERVFSAEEDEAVDILREMERAIVDDEGNANGENQVDETEREFAEENEAVDMLDEMERTIADDESLNEEEGQVDE